MLVSKQARGKARKAGDARKRLVVQMGFERGQKGLLEREKDLRVSELELYTCCASRDSQRQQSKGVAAV